MILSRPKLEFQTRAEKEKLTLGQVYCTLGVLENRSHIHWWVRINLKGIDLRGPRVESTEEFLEI